MIRISHPKLIFVLLAAGLAVGALGCESGLERIDRRVEALLLETTAEMGGNAVPATDSGRVDPDVDERVYTEEQPSTVNPPATALLFDAAADRDAEEVMSRLGAYGEVPADAIRLDLAAALRQAVETSRDYRFAEEEYVIAALRLLIERHQWGPRFFDDISAAITGAGDDGLYDTSLQLVNELRVTQRLPYGGTVSARALALATEDLHERVAGEGVQSAEIILEADVPLLRGAGMVAREQRIQRERDLIYAARDFERFRREFLFEVASDYLDLVVLLQQIDNAELNVESFQQLEQRQRALFEAGRSTPFELAEAENETLEAVDRLNSARENFRLALDRFKVLLGLPVGQALIIEPDGLELSTPDVAMAAAVRAAMNFRLDLQTQRDLVADAARAVSNARNDLLGDLDLAASVSMSTDDDRDRAGLDFDPESTDWQASITYGLPLDREIERLNLRQAQIGYERSRRSYDRFRDDVAANVRAAVRGIDRALFSLQIQERNLEIALLREASIEADPARATIRQKTDAINQTSRARDAVDSARRDLEIAVLGYLLATGQLRVTNEGYVKALPGMRLGAADRTANEPTSG
jgi:outer membrane protein TolC